MVGFRSAYGSWQYRTGEASDSVACAGIQGPSPVSVLAVLCSVASSSTMREGMVTGARQFPSTCASQQ